MEIKKFYIGRLLRLGPALGVTILTTLSVFCLESLRVMFVKMNATIVKMITTPKPNPIFFPIVNFTLKEF